jgi:lipopolysaccharide heptosyltransferase II
VPPVSPGRLVLVRLTAFGDTTGVLPLLGALSKRFPGCELDVVTDVASASLFSARTDVHVVHAVNARARRPARLVSAFRLARSLRRGGFDAILDLQRSDLSSALVRFSGARAWAALDRFAPRSGLLRYFEAAEWLGLGPVSPVYEPRIAPEIARRAEEMLLAEGFDAARPLVCLNPAGGWPTKEWPLPRWAELGRRLEERGARILLLGEIGNPRLLGLAAALPTRPIDLVGRTTPDLAMAIAARASLIVSEDSGLLHLAWVQGVPAIALFGASRSVWSAPIAPGCSSFTSDDLPCGACMRPVCARGDLLCLTRVGVDDAFARAVAALSQRPGNA